MFAMYLADESATHTYVFSPIARSLAKFPESCAYDPHTATGKYRRAVGRGFGKRP